MEHAVSNKGQYEIEVHEWVMAQPIGGPGTRVSRHTTINRQTIDDPFHRTCIRPRGWRLAWAVLRGRLEFVVRVSGTREAYRVVFRGDYKAEPPGPPKLEIVGGCAESDPR